MGKYLQIRRGTFLSGMHRWASPSFAGRDWLLMELWGVWTTSNQWERRRGTKQLTRLQTTLGQNKGQRHLHTLSILILQKISLFLILHFYPSFISFISSSFLKRTSSFENINPNKVISHLSQNRKMIYKNRKSSFPIRKVVTTLKFCCYG